MTPTVLFSLVVLGTSLPSRENTASRFQATFLEAEALYQKGNVRAAIASFRTADALRPTPEGAYNLARAYEKLSEEARAIFFYRLYLRRAPTARDADTIDKRVSQLLENAALRGEGYVELEAPGARWASVAGKEFRELPVALFLEAGEYVVEAAFPNRRERAFLTVLEGQETSQVFVSGEETPAPPLPWLSVDSTFLPSPVALHQASYVVLGTAALALLSGAVMGNMSQSDASLLNRRQDLTVSQAQTLASLANEKGRTANTLWLTSGALAAAGAGLWVFTLPEPGQKEPRP